MSNPRWQGVFPAVTTQMRADQSIDLEATARHIEVLLDSGVQGLVMLGSLGENTLLEPDEKQSVMRMAIEVAAGRVPVLSGVAEFSTAAACRYGPGGRGYAGSTRATGYGARSLADNMAKANAELEGLLAQRTDGPLHLL